MHENTVRSQLLASMKAYQKHPRPTGPDCRPMTPREVETFTSFTSDVYQHLQNLDQRSDDRDLRKGSIDIRSRTADNGLFEGAVQVTEESVQARFGGRSRTFELVEDYRVYPEHSPHRADVDTTRGCWAEQNIAFITGIDLRRDGNALASTAFFVDRLHPERSVVCEGPPSTARED